MQTILRRINFKIAANTTVILLLAVTGFHLLIVAGLIPYDIAWGGRLGSRDEMLRFESVSIAINLFVLTAVSIKAGFLKVKVPVSVINIVMWLLVALFTLNTVGNLASVNFWEMILFTPVTALLAVLCARMALEK